MNKLIIIALFSFSFAFSSNAHIIVRSSKELQEVLAQDEEVGIVQLDGEWFHIDGTIVNIGGKIVPYGNRKPILVGFHQTVISKTDTRGDYWTTQIKGYGAADYFFIDEKFEAIKRARKVDGKEYMRIKASDLIRIDKSSRGVKIKVPPEYSSLLNKSEATLKNAILKVGYWFVQMNIYNLRTDSNYLYGQIDNDYNYSLLDKRPNATAVISFFNFPFKDGGIFLDEKDVLHVPTEYTTARVCCSNNILTLSGNRQLTIEGVTFVGSKRPIVIEGANKHIYNCSFRNCGSGIYCNYGVTNQESSCSVTNCVFENLYNNNVITFVGCDNVVIANNTIHNIGIVNKAGCAIQVGGDNFKVEHNTISCYSYIAIYAGISRDYAAAKMTGIINDNLIDNVENWGQADKQLTDGGGIYVIAHTDGVVVENNIVRNIGYSGCELWGIYLDDGAYNCTVRRNLVYNLWPGQYAVTARYVKECEHSCMNNLFEGNIFIGPCLIAGNRRGIGGKTVIRNNYIAGDLITQGDKYVSLGDNKFVSVSINPNGTISFDENKKVRTKGLSSRIKKLIVK